MPIYRKSYGGSQDDIPLGMDVDANGKVYLTGITFSTDFPLRFEEQSSHAISQIQRDYMAFVIGLYEDGDIHYSTYLGGGCARTYTQNYAYSIAADSNGNAFVTGYTCSSNLSARNGFQTSLQSDYNAFLTKYDSFGHISYSTYFGGSGSSSGNDVAVDREGNAYVTGSIPGGLYTTAGAYRTSGLGFAAKFDTNKSGAQSLIYSTYIDTSGTAIAVDKTGNSWISTGAYCGLYCRVSPSLLKLNAYGTALVHLPLPIASEVQDIAIDGNDNLFYVVQESSGFKAVGLHSDGGTIAESSFDTGSGYTRIYGVAAGPETGVVYIAGDTTSLNFPTTPNAYQPTTNVPNPPNSYFGQGFFAKVQINIPNERAPLIFIPGIGGSTLFEGDISGNPIENLWMDGIVQLLPYPSQKLSKLSLNPEDAPFPKVVPVDAIRDLQVSGRKIYEVYGEFLENLKIQGKYNMRVGCSIEQSQEPPTLFIFPYDWRLSSISAAAKLKSLVDCIHTLYPDKKVNILTHSMGGLVARRYITDHPNNHNIDKWISMVAPWLGAAKALDVIHTGRFIGQFEVGGGIYPYQGSVKNIVQFGAGPHELLPSAWYFINGGKPFAYRGSFNSKPTEYSYTQTYEFINSEFSSQPYINTADFHNNIGQDNWASDISGIKYYHLYGKQKCPNTIGQFIIQPRFSYPLSLRNLRFGSQNKYIDGDGTVPVISANRPLTMLAPNTIIESFNSPNCKQDEDYSHNGILGNGEFRSEISRILDESSGQQPLKIENDSTKLMNSQIESSNQEDLMNYLSVIGVDRIDIFDDQENTNLPLGEGDMAVPGIEYEYGSSIGEILEVPHEITFSADKIVDVKFRASTEKIVIENIRGFGRENASETIKYLDLQLPTGVIAWLKFSANGVENLRYDADGDGIFETEIKPTFHLMGAVANDRTPPNIDVSFSVNSDMATVVVNVTDDETGFNQIRYIVNGETSDHFYNAPFAVNLTQSKLIYVSAEDKAGNRNLLAKWLDVSSPNTTVTQTPAPNASGWSKGNVGVEIKSLDDLRGSGVESLTYSGSGVQNIPEETLSVKEIPFTFPQPSTSADFLSKSLAINMEGVTNLTFFAKDKAGNVEATKTAAVKIDKTAPETSGNYAQSGDRMIVTLISNDALSGVDRISFSIDDGYLQSYNAPFAVSGSGNHSIVFFATDKAGNIEQTKTLSFTIVVVNPVVSITAPLSGSIYPVGAAVNFSGNFSGDSCSSHTAIWTFDNISKTGTVNESNKTVVANYTFTSSGVYLVTLTVNNGCGGTGTANTVDGLTAMFVVYDPDSGFVTGGGWIDSPLGAYAPNPNLIGKASFGFNSRYQQGANVPTGNTEFQFRMADFNFKSISYDWLVGAGAKAQYKGSGTVNGNGNYGFMLTAIDGQLNGGGGTDKFRIKIWDKATGNIVYDNQIGSSDNDNPMTVIGSGSIIIHK